jgi:hypothetical protein
MLARYQYFVQLGTNEADTNKSSSILIYGYTHWDIYRKDVLHDARDDQMVLINE